MNAHLRMMGQKITDCFGFMRAQVVANDVNGLLWSLAGDQIFQKRNELRTGVAVAGLSDHFPALGIRSRIERQRSMAVVFKAVSFGATGRKRQNRIQAIQRLDGTLFVDTEHRGAQWWLEVQANDVGRVLFKLRIGAGHVAAQSMGLDSGPSPHASNPAVRNAQMSSQLYLSQKLEEIEDAATRQVFLDAVAHGSVISWQHINLLGEYDFSDEKLQDNVGIRPPKLTP